MLTAQRFQNRGTVLATEFSASFAIRPALPVELPFANSFFSSINSFLPICLREKAGCQYADANPTLQPGDVVSRGDRIVYGPRDEPQAGFTPSCLRNNIT